MSAQSGVTVDEGLRECFQDACGSDSEVLYITVQISDDDTEFVVADRGEKTGDSHSDWQAVQDTLEPRQPCYVLFRRQGEKNWIVIAWVPPHSPPKLKMLYASSREALKGGLGRQQFDEDYFVGAQDECSFEEYTDAGASHEEKTAELRTWQEIQKYESAVETAPSKVKESVMATLNIPVSSSASSGFESLKAKRSNLLVLRLDDKSEELDAVESGDVSIDELESKLKKEPRFVLFRYDHNRDGSQASKFVYIYYCPETAKPKLKMFYSTCVSNITQLCAKYDLDIDRKLEISIPNEASQENIEFELYPPKAQKDRFAKPSRPGRGRARIHGRRKK